MGPVLAVPILLILGCGAFALLSFAFAWYECANRDPGLLEQRFSPRNLALAAWLLASETLFLLLSLLLHPFGWFRRSESVAEEADAALPVILLHGLFQSRGCWIWMRFRLRRRGFGNVHSISLPPWQDIETLTERLSKKVDELRHATGSERVHLVGHSMGGVIARNYLQLRGGATKAATCTLLASPNSGSKLAPFSLSPLGKLVLPGSSFLQRLGDSGLPDTVRFTAIYSRHDNIILPWENARLEGAGNMELQGVGHTGLLFHHRAFDAVIHAMKEEQP